MEKKRCMEEALEETKKLIGIFLLLLREIEEPREVNLGDWKINHTIN